MITLYHRPQTRSSRFIFLLEELEAPYRIQLVSTRTRDGTGHVDPANPHPHGKVPAIADDGEIVFESSAIALYLTDRYPARQIGPLAGQPGRGAYLSWLAYYSGAFEPALMSKFMNVDVPPVMAGWMPLEDVHAVLVRQLERGPFLLGEHFSAADVLYGTSFALFANSPLVPRSATVDAYVQRVVSRPAYARARDRDAG